MLLAICNTLIALFDRLYSHRGRFTPSASTFLDPDASFFTSLLSTLVALVPTDSVALQTGAGTKYNTSRPKGKLNSMQVAVERGGED